MLGNYGNDNYRSHPCDYYCKNMFFVFYSQNTIISCTRLLCLNLIAL
jgi:hypothetical protein